jgi:thiamine pyrophosphate-dependent acetolactate synthase large subunit-like protein
VPRLRFDLEPGGGVHADARVAAERLLAGREGGDRALDAATRERLDAAQRPETADESTDQAIDPRALMVALDCLLPAQRTLVSDGGHCLGFPALHVHAGEPGDYLLPQGTHAIGMGLGAALGVAAARPERPIVLFIGDGSLAMTLGDLVTVAEGAVPLLIVVLNDQAYGAERHLLDLAGTANHMSRFGDIEFAEVASGLGLRAATIRRASDLDALAATLREPLTEPLLLDGKIVPDLRARWMEELV